MLTTNSKVHSTPSENDGPYPLVRNALGVDIAKVEVAGRIFGGDEVQIIAGPCSVESEEQFLKTGAAVLGAGARLLRAGVFKPRTSPYAFQGLEEQGLPLLSRAREVLKAPVVSEIMDVRMIDAMQEHVSCFQVGARNMQNFPLLKELGKRQHPVLLKRGFGNTVDEFLWSAEYLLAGGNTNVILCERGIRTFENTTRFTLDVGAIARLKQVTHLPVVADPSHPAGDSRLVSPLAAAAIAAGADGILIEVHNRPEDARSDKDQALSPAAFELCMQKVRAVAGAMGRTMADSPSVG